MSLVHSESDAFVSSVYQVIFVSGKFFFPNLSEMTIWNFEDFLCGFISAAENYMEEYIEGIEMFEM